MKPLVIGLFPEDRLTPYAALFGNLVAFRHPCHPEHAVLDNSDARAVSYRCLACTWFSWKPR